MRSCTLVILALALLAGLAGVAAWVFRDDLASLTTPTAFDDADRARTWTDARGREIEAILLAASQRDCLLRVTENQTVYRLPLEKLSEKDRRYAKRWRADRGEATMPPAMPARFPATIRCAGEPGLSPGTTVRGNSSWDSRHFEYVVHGGIERELLESVAAVCESIDRAVRRTPLPLRWGREGRSRRTVHLYPDAETYRRASGGPAAFAAHYDARSGDVHIPVSSFFGPDLAYRLKRFELKKRKRLDVVVHEMIHQAAPAIGSPHFPAWVTEGLAEYYSAMHVSRGTFNFTQPRRNVRRYLARKLGIDGLLELEHLSLHPLGDFCARSLGRWNRETVKEQGHGAGFIQYAQALIVTEFFCHAEGNRMRSYLEAALSGVPEKEAARAHLLADRPWSDIEELVVRHWEAQGLTLRFVESPALDLDAFDTGVGVDSSLSSP